MKYELDPTTQELVKAYWINGYMRCLVGYSWLNNEGKEVVGTGKRSLQEAMNFAEEAYELYETQDNSESVLR